MMPEPKPPNEGEMDPAYYKKHMYNEWAPPEPKPQFSWLGHMIFVATQSGKTIDEDVAAALAELATLQEKAGKWDHVTRWPKGLDIPCPPDGFDSWTEFMVANWQKMKGGRTWEDVNLERDCGRELAAWRADETDAEKWRAQEKMGACLAQNTETGELYICYYVPESLLPERKDADHEETN